MDLIRKNTPVAAVFDIHRDAIPKEHYDTMVNGEYMSRVRIVIGRSNQNRKANEQLAYKIKAIADKAYPGLIKDIYIGKGEYNQELSPRSLLFELGTHEISKEAAQKATDNLRMWYTRLYLEVYLNPRNRLKRIRTKDRHKCQKRSNLR